MLIKLNPIELTTLHEGHAPVDALCKTFAQECFSNVALGVDNGSDEVGIVHRLQDDLNVALQQARLNKKAGFFRVSDDNRRIGFAVRVETEAWTTDAADHQRNILEARQKECSNGGAVADMLDDRIDWLASLQIDEMAGVLDLPNNVSCSGWRSAEASFGLRLSLIL